MPFQDPPQEFTEPTMPELRDYRRMRRAGGMWDWEDEPAGPIDQLEWQGLKESAKFGRQEENQMRRFEEIIRRAQSRNRPMGRRMLERSWKLEPEGLRLPSPDELWMDNPFHRRPSA